jgi:hypothetical protein
MDIIIIFAHLRTRTTKVLRYSNNVIIIKNDGTMTQS